MKPNVKSKIKFFQFLAKSGHLMAQKFNDSQLEWMEGEKKTLLKTPIAEICQTKATSSDGQQHNYISIDSRDWVAVIPVKNENFIMVKQWRHGEKALSVEFPGGVIDDGETPLQGAVRELKEETGCLANRLVYLGKVNPNPAFMTNHFHVFAAFELEETGRQELDADEYLNYLEMPKSEVFAKMGTSQMPHALMCCALMLYRQAEDSGKI